MVQRTDKEMLKMQGYLGECEGAIAEQRSLNKELEQQLKTTKDLLHRAERNNE